MADGINHAIPTHAELTDSLGFLMGAGLIAKADHRYSLTGAGVAMLAKTRIPPPRSVFDVWHRLEAELLKSAPASYVPDTLNEVQFGDALNTYKERFHAQYGKLMAGGP